MAPQSIRLSSTPSSWLRCNVSSWCDNHCPPQPAPTHAPAASSLSTASSQLMSQFCYVSAFDSGEMGAWSTICLPLATSCSSVHAPQVEPPNLIKFYYGPTLNLCDTTHCNTLKWLVHVPVFSTHILTTQTRECAFVILVLPTADKNVCSIDLQQLHIMHNWASFSLTNIYKALFEYGEVLPPQKARSPHTFKAILPHPVAQETLSF